MCPGAAGEGRFYKARDEVSVQSGGMGRGREGSGRAGDGLGEYVVGCVASQQVAKPGVRQTSSGQLMTRHKLKGWE